MALFCKKWTGGFSNEIIFKQRYERRKKNFPRSSKHLAKRTVSKAEKGLKGWGKGSKENNDNRWPLLMVYCVQTPFYDVISISIFETRQPHQDLIILKLRNKSQREKVICAGSFNTKSFRSVTITRHLNSTPYQSYKGFQEAAKSCAVKRTWNLNSSIIYALLLSA